MWPYMEYYVNWVNQFFECSFPSTPSLATKVVHCGSGGLADKHKLWRYAEACLRVELMGVFCFALGLGMIGIDMK